MRFIRTLWFAVLTFIVFTQKSYAQDVQMATLQHGDELSAYYGADAFAKAMEKAEHGDVINLSAGIFNPPYITKAVKIYGAGYIQDSDSNRDETKMSVSVDVDIEDGKQGLIIEGIHASSLSFHNAINNVIVSKSKFDQYLSFADYSKNCMVEKCRIGSTFTPGNHSENLVLDNSIVTIINGNESDATFNIRHSIIGWLSWNDRYGTGGLKSASISNSVIFSGGGTSTVQYTNCVLNYDFQLGINYKGCYYVPDPTTIFENLPSFVNDYKTYQIPMDVDFILDKEMIDLNHLLSSDGTEIGIHGGTSPFTTVPSNPQIVSKEIAGETDADGKLAVKLTVEAQER